MRQAKGTSIRGALVERLFGLYDYRLGVLADAAPAESNLLVLYGDNGSGKTTLLKLVYHLLSKEQNKGHRTALAAIPLRRFVVQLEDGTEIGMYREGKSLTGSYHMFVNAQGSAPLECFALVDADGKINHRPDEESIGRWNAVMEAINDLGVSLYYLPDNRRIQAGTRESSGIDIDAEPYEVVYEAAGRVVRRQRVKPALHTAVSELEDLIRHEVFRAANVGEANINSIYAEIAKRVIATKGKPVAASVSQGKDLVKALDQLAERSLPFSGLGLIPQLELSTLADLARRAPATTRRTLATVLQPYIESVTARLNALQATERLLNTFITTLNTFYSQKTVTFDVREGVRIYHPGGGFISLESLSSGEQQLLLLFCNTVRARSHSTIFIVDEPELSLNVKWQRRLLEALLSLVAGTNVQFVIATHSIELLANYRHAVLRLKNNRAVPGV